MRRGLSGAFKQMLRARDEDKETYAAPSPPQGGGSGSYPRLAATAVQPKIGWADLSGIVRLS